AAPATVWRMAPAVQAYPQAGGGSADDGWLVIWEGPHPGAPLTGDSGKLLDNMLRALRLHHSAHVWIAGVQRPGSEALSAAGLAAEAVDWQPLDQSLPHCLQHTRPARVLVLGLHAARAVLGSEEALGRLRAQVHQLHGTPAVVSYDPAYLLRSPHAKPAAWADLCRAHALRPPPAP
ncbi:MULTISPECIES: uracil-DNA glycosylase family protein, partial [Comamonas]